MTSWKNTTVLGPNGRLPKSTFRTKVPKTVKLTKSAAMQDQQGTGHDSIPAKALKLGACELAVPLTKLYNSYLAENGCVNGRKEYGHRSPRKTIRYTKRTTGQLQFFLPWTKSWNS